MASVASIYTTGDSPPTYDEVANKLNALVGASPTPDKVLDATALLSDTEIDILIDGADSHWPLETDEQKANFAVGCGQALSSPEGKAQFQRAGDEATQATRDIGDIFVRLHFRIAEVDNIHRTGFESEIIRLHQEYQNVLNDSRRFSNDISWQATRFDQIIIKLCADESIPIQARRDQLENYITTTTSFKSDAQRIISGFRILTGDFTAFVTSFSAWAKDKEGEITDQIRVIEQELDDLHKRLFRLESSLRAFEVLFGASIPATGKLVKMFPLFAPWIILGGAITAFVAFATIAGLAAGISRTNRQIYRKNQEKDRLQAELEDLRRTRAELEGFGNESLTQFDTAISILTGVWEQVLSDARIAQDWLVKGADPSHLPEYMEVNIRHGVNKYEAVSSFLSRYARGTLQS